MLSFLNKDLFGFIPMLISDEAEDSTQNEGIILNPGYNYQFGLSKTKTIQAPKPYSNCIEGLTSTSSYNSLVYQKTVKSYPDSSYKYSNCVRMCQQKLVGEKCGFQIRVWFGPAFFDNMREDNNNNNDEECQKSAQSNFKDYLLSCDCPMECEIVQYPFSWSFLNFGYGPNTSIEIYFIEMKETIISESPKYQPSDLLGLIGGNLGGFLGFSYLTMGEFFEIFVEILIHFCDRVRSRTIRKESNANWFMKLVFIKLPDQFNRLKRLVCCFRKKDKLQNSHPASLSSLQVSTIDSLIDKNDFVRAQDYLQLQIEFEKQREEMERQREEMDTIKLGIQELLK
jgi:hypothetical protein